MKRPFRTLPSLSSRTAAAYITHATAGANHHGTLHGHNPNTAAFIHNPYAPSIPSSPNSKHRYPGSTAAAFNFVHPSFPSHASVSTGSAIANHPQFAATASAMTSHPGIHGFPSSAKGIAGVYDAAASSFNTFTAMLSQNGFHPSVPSAAAAAMYQNHSGYFQVSPNSPPGLAQKMYYSGAMGNTSNPTAAYYPSMNKYMDDPFGNAHGYNNFYQNSYANSAANFMHSNNLSPSVCVKQE